MNDDDTLNTTQIADLKRVTGGKRYIKQEEGGRVRGVDTRMTISYTR